MKNIMRDIDSLEDDDFIAVERFNHRQGFKDESYKRERRGNSIRKKRQQKEREREQMTKDYEIEDE